MTTQTIKVLMIAQKNKPNTDGKVPIFARITVFYYIVIFRTFNIYNQPHATRIVFVRGVV